MLEQDSGKIALDLIIADVLPIQAAPTTSAHLLFKKQDFPTFDGQRRNYQTFKRIWRESVTETGVDLILQLSLLKKGCPKAVEADLKNLSSLDEIWQVLDQEYSNVEDLTHEVTEGLLKFQYSSAAKTGQKFTEL